MPILLPEYEVQDIDNEMDWKIAEMKYEIMESLIMEHNKGLDSLDREMKFAAPGVVVMSQCLGKREHKRLQFCFMFKLRYHLCSKQIYPRFAREYYSKYLSQIHQSDSTKIKQREIMYELDYGFIKKHLKPNGKVLDVGCSNGKFLDLFE